MSAISKISFDIKTVAILLTVALSFGIQLARIEHVISLHEETRRAVSQIEASQVEMHSELAMIKTRVGRNERDIEGLKRSHRHRGGRLEE